MIILPYPPADLNPNKRLFWAVRGKAKQSYYNDCYLLAKASGLKIEHDGLIAISIDFYPPDRRKRDDDNILAAFKSGRDAVAAALGIDDARFVTSFFLHRTPRKHGEVHLSFSRFEKVA